MLRQEGRPNAFPPIYSSLISRKADEEVTIIIEAGIEPLVTSLNRVEFLRTVYSCEGHFDRPHSEKFLPTAYVTFGVTEVPKFIPLYERCVLMSRRETEVDLKLTYDCVLGRYTLSVWTKRILRDPAQKRAAIDAAIARLSEMVGEFIEQYPSSHRDDREDESRMPCGEPAPPCTMVIPAKEMVCPFA